MFKLHWTKDLTLFKVKYGNYQVKMTTINYGGNITNTNGTFTLELHQDRSLLANLLVEQGSEYNESTDATWTGTFDVENRTMNIKERFGHHPGYFIYTAQINDKVIEGTYFWDIKPTAGGRLIIELV
ncbi:unnamed protein product [Didymodactylos carnosus]|nr:unnamed protein product [Didymodactylos carnosus]CAF4446994.1 unnamed protein product [Didymodactylos carnosus]